MTTFQAFVLGIIQGVTEFLPISSSGHLVLIPYLLGWPIPVDQAFIFDVLVQMGTLIAVIVYFWKDLWAIISVTIKSVGRPNLFSHSEVRLGVYIMIATLPAVVFGYFFKGAVEDAFNNPTATALFLLLTALLLVIAERVGKRNVEIDEIRWVDAFRIGVFQALALFPGVSRSGATITGGMISNMKRPAAARFSFLMAVPVMIGAGALAAFDLVDLTDLSAFVTPLIVGFLTSAVVGYLAIHWLLRYLAEKTLTVFSIYLVVFALLALFLGG
jgi:undecaprenyl-diphosphatase